MSLAAQVDHLRAYLELMTLRMGDRLTFAIDVPAEVAALEVPPLLLQPLVENAIRHGLEPKVDGRRVHVSARREGNVVELVVADTGVGFATTRPATAGSGLRHCQPARAVAGALRRRRGRGHRGQRARGRADHAAPPRGGSACSADSFQMNNKASPTAVIADDEPNLARYLRERLRVAWPELVVAGVAGNGPEARALIATEAPDIAFLDIRMPGLSGLDVARDLAGVHVVFVTAHDEYALAADSRSRAGAGAAARTSLRTRNRRRRAGRLDSRRRRVAGAADRREDVCYFESNDKYTSVFTVDGEALIRTSLRELAAQLDGERFWQIHCGRIVNVAHIASTIRDVTGRLAVKLKQRPEKLAVSRAYAHRFR